MTFEEIGASIAPEFAQFQSMFDSAFAAGETLIRSVLTHVQSQKGKQIRPIFIILCAKLCSAPTTATYQMASALELLHTASLLHDDVVDKTDMRRGKPSANSLFDNKTAILTGDFLLSKALGFAAATDDSRLFRILADLGALLARGELLQIQYSYSIPTEEEYIDVIRKKTAVLFDSCAHAAAISTDAPAEETKALRRFADALGICFQIKDDIFDYSPNAQIGKPTLNDIREGKITLPLLHALNQISHSDAIKILDAVKNAQFTEDFFYNIGTLVSRHHGIEYATHTIEHYRTLALDALNFFPDSLTRTTLASLLDYVISRSR